MEIGCFDFTLIGGFPNRVLEEDLQRGLYNCYKKPSKQKKDIFEMFCHWFNDYGGMCGIHSFNHHIITIAGYIVVNGIQIGILFTPNHNYFFQLEREF